MPALSFGENGVAAGVCYETVCLDVEVCLPPWPPGTGHQTGWDGNVVSTWALWICEPDEPVL